MLATGALATAVLLAACRAESPRGAELRDRPPLESAAAGAGPGGGSSPFTGTSGAGVSADIRRLADDAIAAAGSADDPRAALDAAGMIAADLGVDRRRRVALELERLAASRWERAHAAGHATTSIAGTAVPGRPAWLQARMATPANVGEPPRPADRAEGIGTVGGDESEAMRQEQSLGELLAWIAPPAAEQGPRLQPPAADPANRAAAADRLERARAARAEGRLLRAITGLREAAGLDPASMAVRRELARSYELIGNVDLARRSWQDVAALRPDDPEAAVALAIDALDAGRPLGALGILQPAVVSGARDGDVGGSPSSAAELDDVASIFAFARQLALLKACEAIGAHAAAAEVAASLADAPPDDLARRAAAMRGLAATPANLLRRLGDAEFRRGRLEAARVAYARAEASVDAADTAEHAADEERAAVLVRRVSLAFLSDDAGEAWAALHRASAAHPASAAPAVIAVRTLTGSGGRWMRDGVDPSRSPGSAIAKATAPALDPTSRDAEVAGLAALAFRSTPEALARATDRLEPLPVEPSPHQPLVSDRLEVAGAPWPHPLPATAEAAARLLRRATEPFTPSAAPGAPPVVRAMALAACGWPGRAWTLLDAEVRGGSPTADDPRIHVARVRLAGLLQDRGALRQAIADGVKAGLADAALAAAPSLGSRGVVDVRPGDAHPSDAWRATFGMAAVAALARTHRADEAVALAEALLGAAQPDAAALPEPSGGMDAPTRAGAEAGARAGARTGATDVAPRDAASAASAASAAPAARAARESGFSAVTPEIRSALRLTLAAAVTERAWIAPFGSARRDDLRTAIDLAARTTQTRPGDTVAWRLLDQLLAPTGPVADAAARTRHQRQWAAAVQRSPGSPGASDGAALDRRRLIVAGHLDEADDAARLQLILDPADDTAIEDLLVARSRAGRAEAALAWIEGRLRRHPADPAAAAARLRLEANAGRIDRAWDRLEERLDREPEDLVALRLAETAAGLAGNRMMRLVMGETRLLTRPPSPYRALMLARLAIDAGQDADALRAATAFTSMVDDAVPRDVHALSVVLRQVSRTDPARATRADGIEIDLATGLVDAGIIVEEPILRGLAAALRRDGAGARSLAIIDGLAARDPAGDDEAGLAWPPRSGPDASTARGAETGPTSGGNGDPIIEAWRTMATGLVDRGHADRAAIAVARRILRGNEAGARLDAFVALFVALDAAALAGSREPSPAGVRPLVDPVVDLLLVGASGATDGAKPVADAPGAVGVLRAAAGLDGAPMDGPAAPDAASSLLRPAEGELTRPVLARLAAQGRVRAYAAADGTGDAADPGVPPLAIALRRAAGVHRMVGRPDVADSILEDALRLRPEDPMILNDLGYTRLVAASGPVPEAARMIERAMAADPGNPAILDSLGWLRYLEGVIDGDPDGRDALSLIQRAVDGDPEPGAEVLLHLGDARWRAGRREAAIEAWTRGRGLAGSPRHRASTEQQLEVLQIGVWGVLVRAPADMYDALFATVVAGLRDRLESVERGVDAAPPITPTYAEMAPTR